MASTKQLKVDLLMNVKASQDAMSFIKQSSGRSSSQSSSRLPEDAYPAQRYAYGVESQVFKDRALENLSEFKRQSAERLNLARLQTTTAKNIAIKTSTISGATAREMREFAMGIGYSQEQIDASFRKGSGRDSKGRFVKGGPKYHLTGYGGDIAKSYYEESYKSKAQEENLLVDKRRKETEREVKLTIEANKIAQNQLIEDEKKLKADRRDNQKRSLADAGFGRKARNFGSWDRKRQDAYLRPFVDDSGNIIQGNLEGKHSQRQIEQLMSLRNPVQTGVGGAMNSLKGAGMLYLGETIGKTIASVLDDYTSGYKGSISALNAGYGTTNGLGLTANALRSQAANRYGQERGNISLVSGAIGGLVSGLVTAGSPFGIGAGVAAGAGMGNSLVDYTAMITNNPGMSPSIKKEFGETVANQYASTEKAGYDMDAAVSGIYAAGLGGSKFSKKYFNKFKGFGYSPSETLGFMGKFGSSGRTSIGADELLSLAGIGRGYGIGTESMAGFMSGNRFSGANSGVAIRSILGDAFSKGLPTGMGQTALDRYSSIAGQMGSVRSGLNPGDVLGVSSYFANMGGGFGLNNPGSSQRTLQAMSSMSNLQGGFGQAAGFLAATKTLQGKGGRFGLFDIGEQQQQGGTDYYKNLIGMFKRPGLDPQFGMQALQQVTGLPYADIRAMYEKGDFSSTSAGAALTESEVATRGRQGTSSLLVKSATITAKDLEGIVKAIEYKSELIINGIKNMEETNQKLDRLFNQIMEDRKNLTNATQQLDSTTKKVYTHIVTHPRTRD